MQSMQIAFKQIVLFDKMGYYHDVLKASLNTSNVVPGMDYSEHKSWETWLAIPDSTLWSNTEHMHWLLNIIYSYSAKTTWKTNINVTMHWVIPLLKQDSLNNNCQQCLI